MTETLADLVAHRGDLTRLPENTLIALEHALECGACYVECDLQMNREGDFILIHDDNCLRTAGIQCNVLESTTVDLRQISVHEPEKYQQRFAPTYLATLDDFLQLLGHYPKAQAFVEIKEESLAYWGREQVIKPLLKRLAQHHKRCILISFDHAAIKYIKKNSDIRTGWVLKKYDKTHHQQAEALQPDYLLCNYRKTPDVGELWPGRWNWLLYDLTDPDLANSYIKRGIRLIETGDISGLMQQMGNVRNCKEAS